MCIESVFFKVALTESVWKNIFDSISYPLELWKFCQTINANYRGNRICMIRKHFPKAIYKSGLASVVFSDYLMLPSYAFLMIFWSREISRDPWNTKLFVAKHASRVEMLEHFQNFPWNWSKLEDFCLDSNFNNLHWIEDKLIWKLI